jgi:hypothetical protein
VFPVRSAIEEGLELGGFTLVTVVLTAITVRTLMPLGRLRFPRVKYARFLGACGRSVPCCIQLNRDFSGCAFLLHDHVVLRLLDH